MDQEPTRQSRASRLLDLGGPLLRRLHLGPSRRSGQSLLAAAVGRARCDDWGDGPFREGLESLLDALRHDRHLRLTAWADIHEFLIGLLVNRLLIRQYQQRNPACLHEPIDRPIFILGLPRSGTTLLY
ncbi:MAG: sulfotransferase, partial [Planctomycetota bacterium]